MKNRPFLADFHRFTIEETAEKLKIFRRTLDGKSMMKPSNPLDEIHRRPALVSFRVPLKKEA